MRILKSKIRQKLKEKADRTVTSYILEAVQVSTDGKDDGSYYLSWKHFLTRVIGKRYGWVAKVLRESGFRLLEAVPKTMTTVYYKNGITVKLKVKEPNYWSR